MTNWLNSDRGPRHCRDSDERGFSIQHWAALESKDDLGFIIQLMQLQ